MASCTQLTVTLVRGPPVATQPAQFDQKSLWPQADRVAAVKAARATSMRGTNIRCIARQYVDPAPW